MVAEATEATGDNPGPQPAQCFRPLLHHLNADSSWLLQLPAPPSSVENAYIPARSHFNIIIDPWLSGPQSDVASWFSTQWHAHAPAYTSIAQVNRLALRAEQGSYEANEADENVIDAVTICHEFTDHCHRETLLQLDKSVPVVAPPNAAALIKSWGHFERVVEMTPFGEENVELDQILPAWVHITRLQDPKDALYYHSAIIIQFKSWQQDSEKEEEESVVYTPHGITPTAVETMQTLAPSLKPLCLIHGLHDIWLTLMQQLNLGGHNGLKVQRALKAKYWLGTHDEVKIGGGLVGMFLRRKVITLDDALSNEPKTLKIKGTDDAEDVTFQEIGNGQMKVLD